jgi:1,4-alpha-glucan branching enzyme
MSALNHLYSSYPALYQKDHSWEGFRWLNVDDRERSSVAFMRIGTDNAASLVCVLNFTPVTYQGFIFGLPKKGFLKEILSSDEMRFGGRGERNTRRITAKKRPFLEFPYSAAVTLPALSALVFEYYPVLEENTEQNQ